MGTRRKPKKAKKQADQTQNRWRNIILGGVIIVGIIGLGYLLLDSLRGPEPIEAIAGVVDHDRQTAEHVDGEIEAGDIPPTGGGHSPQCQN